MNEIPKPPQPPEPTEVIGNDFIPKRPVPPDVARSPIQILYPDETSCSDRWTIGFYWGSFIGFGFGIIFIKILIKLGF
ncbi:hypothetical protein NQ841_09040 [Acinetobacter baumannii]|nr:hypothetical protein [Acinetobacter baumannii]